MQNIWYKNAIFYSLDVETFMDSDGDDVGDFQGLTKCLNHLSGLGITCLWLLPFYQERQRAGGRRLLWNSDSRLCPPPKGVRV
ncbi:alpha-amylase family glycosyl hydrolase [Nostoc flagelliforme]|uniref:alpha-amylase family glycosyl hydrolase n=1 Tax=Nostoc flagelliforme TaxID=1306274 RepID=UPI001F551067|nr:alpha-amylase family glycosyl hydrolase [Nostoc flagelliforme]